MGSKWIEYQTIDGVEDYDVVFLRTEKDYKLLAPLLEREGYFFKAHRPWRKPSGEIDTTPWRIFKENTALILGDKLIRIQNVLSENYI